MRTESSPTPRSARAKLRLIIATGVSAGVVAGAWLVPSYGGASQSSANAGQRTYAAVTQAATQAKVAQLREAGTIWLPNGTHVHTDGASVKDGKVSFDPAEKNALSRTMIETADPVSARQATLNRTAAATQRNQTEPTLVPTTLNSPRRLIPQNRYAAANGCYKLLSLTTKKWLGTPASPRFASTKTNAMPLFFKATDLGSYLLWTRNATMITKSGSGLGTTAKPGAAAEWRMTRVAPGRFRLDHGGAQMLPGSIRVERSNGCSSFPEAGVGVTGRPFGGASTQQEVRGYIDAHTHGMAYQFLGGMVHCGKPWDRYGVTLALKDCVDHETTGGKGSVLEAFLSGDLDGHDPVGWPTFKDWPAPQSLTHEGTYYKWLERSWRGGQRILVNLLVENNQLCQLYPLKKNSCNDMDSVRLQAKNMRQLERYVDAQSGGPGKGWYRIVTNPDQARRVINAGKMAVVMGIETSVPFDCTANPLSVAAGRSCTKASLDKQLDEVRRMGVSQMELVNKFDNSLAGVAGDEGATGNLVNTANILETGRAWDMRTCEPNDPDIHDKDQNTAMPSEVPAETQDALFGALAKVSGVLPVNPLPLYPSPHHCNQLGLSDLGAHVIKGLAKRHMLFDPDHMSVKARKSALDVIEAIRYPGVLSSHSWSTIDAYPRIYRAKGFIAPYAGDSDGFVKKWRQHLNWSNPKTYWGFGFGADINGLGAQGLSLIHI